MRRPFASRIYQIHDPVGPVSTKLAGLAGDEHGAAKRAQRQECQVTLAPERGKGEPMPSKYHNLSNEALADELGRVDAIAKAAEIELRALKDEFKASDGCGFVYVLREGNKTRVNVGSRSGMVRLDQAQTREIGDRPPLIVEGDRLGIVHSEQDIGGCINAHVIDNRAERMVACLYS
jgi:hypothetical protein